MLCENCGRLERPKEVYFLMNLFTTTYWQAAQNHSALLLQQYQYRHTPVCLIAVCGGCTEAQGKAGAYLTGHLLQWFRGLSFKQLARNPNSCLLSLESSLQDTVRRLDNDLVSCGHMSGETSLSLSGILCADDQFLIFTRGKQHIYLLNKGFGKGRMQHLSEELTEAQTSSNTLIMSQGILQRDVGLLFCTDTFRQLLANNEICECLYVDELCGAEQVRKRLRELGNRAEDLGGRNLAAVLLLARA